MTPAPAHSSACPRWVWAVLGLWLLYSLGVLAWHVLQDPVLRGICSTS